MIIVSLILLVCLIWATPYLVVGYMTASDALFSRPVLVAKLSAGYLVLAALYHVVRVA